MMETGEYLKLAAANFKKTETHLRDTEVSLRILLVNMENCLERLRRLSLDERKPVNQPDISRPVRHLTALEKLYPVKP